MRAISEMSTHMLSNCVAVFTDIDDTLTTDGLLPAAAYEALEALTNAGFQVVPITGRPAGWCDMIARLWPVAGIVGENGAFYFSYDRQNKAMRSRFFADEDERRANRIRLEQLREQILREVPGTGIASDQQYREADLAIDFCEDVPALPKTAVQHILDIFDKAGAVAKLSSIHVNGWFGDYDKLSMTRKFANDILKIDIDADRENIIFVGDSPNDGPMFGFFPNSCGVANVRDFDPSTFNLPTFVAPSKGGEGFVQIADRILSTVPNRPERSVKHD
ncbi:MAG: HAD-IIB family hydrolase [Rhizobiales bacterium]|nr:HAD-IIB family hydrolase [Hyphomicrobiales bacterium]